MSNKPIIYTWKDANGPGINLTGNNQNRLKQILKACLIDGYGDKPSAGWEMVHEHPNGFSLTNGHGVINLVSDLPNMSNKSTHIYLIQNVHDKTQAILGGDGLCSGEYRKGISDTNRRHSFSAEKINKWVLIADKNTFVFFAHSPGSYNNVSLYVGQLNEVMDGFKPFVCFGGWISSYNDYNNDELFKRGSCSINPLTGLTDLSRSYPTADLPFSGSDLDIDSSEGNLIPIVAYYSSKAIGTLRLVSIAYPYIVGDMKSVLKLLGADDIMKVTDVDSIKYSQGHWSRAGIVLTDHEDFR